MNRVSFQITNLLLVALICLLFTSSLRAQHVGQYAIVKLENGDKVKGKVIAADDEYITIENSQVQSKIALSSIKNSTYGATERDVKTAGHKPSADSYAVLPSARPIGKGNSYYKNTLLFFNQFNIGVSDVFSLGMGFESASLVTGQWPRIFSLTPKFSIGSDNSYVGIGTSLLVATDSGDIGYGGLLYANYTYGTDRKNITAGLSYSYNSDSFDESNLLLNVNMSYPLSHNVIAMSELVLGDFDGIAWLFALRFMSRGGFSFDVGFSRFIETERIILPVLSALVPIGR